MDSKLASDGTHWPDVRKRLPRVWLSHRWLSPSTYQAPMHPLFDPMLNFLDKDRCCGDPALPHKLSWRCLCPACEKTPALCRLPAQFPRCSPHVTIPKWCSETESAGTSHSGWWTQTVNRLDAHRPRRLYGANINTNQDLVAWPRDIHVHTDGRQSDLRPELVDWLITSTQTQHFNEGGNFRHRPKIRVHRTSFVNNDVFGKWVLPVSHDQRSSHYFLPLALYFCWTHGIPS